MNCHPVQPRDPASLGSRPGLRATLACLRETVWDLILADRNEVKVRNGSEFSVSSRVP